MNGQLDIDSIVANNAKCPIWNTPAEVTQASGCDAHYVTSKRAGGKYYITGPDEVTLKQCSDDRLKVRLTSWLIDQRRLGIKWPTISTEEIDYQRNRADTSVRERADRLLNYIGRISPDIGHQPFYSGDEWGVLAWSESIRPEEVRYLLGELKEQGLLRSGISTFEGTQYSITMEGHSRLSESAHNIVVSSTVFVAMWFDPTMEDAWNRGIRPGIKSAGYEAVRIDGVQHNDKIDDRIIAEIRRSRFLVADFTQGEDGPRGGVYYEAGFARGIGIPVIFLCRKDSLKKIHFDTRQYNHIVWEDPEELKRRLSDRIAATIGEGPHASSP